MESERNIIKETYVTGPTGDVEPQVSRISIPRIREARDMVYSGTINMPHAGETIVSGVSPSSGKKHQKRKFSPFSIVLILLAVAISSVLYIGNILVVGKLMTQINRLQNKHRQIVNQQELLRAQIIKLSSLERIRLLANDQAGLQNSKQLPVWIEVDPEHISQVEEVIQQQMENKR